MGELIVFEGIDGSGKTDIAQALSMHFGEISVFISKKSTEAMLPFQTKFMSEVKKVLWERLSNDAIHEIDEESWLYLHMLWYHMVQEYVLVPKLKQYRYVMMDGWYYKFFARHIVNKKMDTVFAEQLVSRLLPGDRVFMLDADPEVCYKRKKGVSLSECGAHRDGETATTKNAFCKYQRLVFDAYLYMDKEQKFIKIDTNSTVSNAISKILEVL